MGRTSPIYGNPLKFPESVDKRAMGNHGPTAILTGQKNHVSARFREIPQVAPVLGHKLSIDVKVFLPKRGPSYPQAKCLDDVVNGAMKGQIFPI